MHTTSLLMGILPLLTFVIIDSFFGMKVALVATVLLAIAEAIYTIILIGELDWLSNFTLFSVLLLTAISFYKKNQLFLKLQPVFLSLALSLTLLISYLINEPFLLIFAKKYHHLLPEQFSHLIKTNHPLLIKQLELGTLNIGIGLLLHALLCAWAAYKLSNWWWIAMRGIGFYLIMLATMIITKLQIHLY